MRLTRCFVPTPLAAGAVVTLPLETAARLTRVMRLRAGDPVTLFDGRGGEYAAHLLERAPGARAALQVQIAEQRTLEREAPLRIILLQCLARGDRMDWVVQKATELGVSEIVPVISRHTVVQLSTEARQRRHAHWQAVSIGACEQCGRNRLPEVRPVCALSEVYAQLPPDGVRLLLSPQAEPSLPQALRQFEAVGTVALLIGPEGGLAADERELAEQQGFRACRLGPRILRSETAPVAALASIQAVVGDFL